MKEIEKCIYCKHSSCIENTENKVILVCVPKSNSSKKYIIVDTENRCSFFKI